jgi:hypothetical protein
MGIEGGGPVASALSPGTELMSGSLVAARRFPEMSALRALMS